MLRKYFRFWNQTFSDLRNTETASEQACGGKERRPGVAAQQVQAFRPTSSRIDECPTLADWTFSVACIYSMTFRMVVRVDLQRASLRQQFVPGHAAISTEAARVAIAESTGRSAAGGSAAVRGSSNTCICRDTDTVRTPMEQTPSHEAPFFDLCTLSHDVLPLLHCRREPDCLATVPEGSSPVMAATLRLVASWSLAVRCRTIPCVIVRNDFPFWRAWPRGGGRH